MVLWSQKQVIWVYKTVGELLAADASQMNSHAETNY